MQVLVLAAGKSSRMAPVSDKCFLNFLGKPLIEHQLQMLVDVGFNDVIVVGSKENVEKIEEACGGLGLGFTSAVQDDGKGMAGAMLAAEGLIKGQDLLVFSSNDVVDKEAFSLLMEAANGVSDGYLLGKRMEKYFPGGYLEVSDGLITNIVEKPGEGNEPSDMVNLVLHVFKKPLEFLSYLKNVSSNEDDVYEVAIDKMIKEGKKFEAVAYDGFWQAIKFPWHMQPVFEYFFSLAEKKIASSAEISDRAVVKGEVIIEEGAKVLENSVINGPVYLGKNTVVANNCLVRNAHIGDGCVIGFGTEVARSYIDSKVWTHSNYVGDSVICSNVSFGAGTVTGNLRLDERDVMVEIKGKKVSSQQSKFGCIIGKDVRVGVNSSIMPGCRIGSGCFIGGGIIVGGVIKEKSFVRGEVSLKVSANKVDVSEMGR